MATEEAAPRSSRSFDSGTAMPAPGEVPRRRRAKPSPPSKDEAAGLWCRFVWCYERCYKQESKPRYHALVQAAAEVGGTLVRFKKAHKFDVGFLWRNPLPPYLLLSDWREAKQCLQALAQRPAQLWPVCMVVMADGNPEFDRAIAWAEALPAGSPNVMVAHFAEARAIAVECMASACARRPGAAGQPSVAVPADGAWATAGSSAVGQQAPVEPAGTGILSPLRRGRTAAELADLLRGAMPEHYDD
mmetsp:Transcript_108272/g.334366  ORF Transcript_108272/g.334366 Transcript_108272/m.334366 type:complete len:245 (-) Transcript_108272:22-756(-)